MMDSTSCAAPSPSIRSPFAGSAHRSMWICIPTSSGACVLPATPGRVEVSGLAQPLLMEVLELSIWDSRMQFRHRDLDLKLLRAVSCPLPSEHLESQMSSCQKQMLKDSTDMFYTFFTWFQGNEDYKHPLFEAERWDFGMQIFGKFGKEAAWSSEFGWWTYLQACKPERGSTSKHNREK